MLAFVKEVTKSKRYSQKVETIKSENEIGKIKNDHYFTRKCLNLNFNPSDS